MLSAFAKFGILVISIFSTFIFNSVNAQITHGQKYFNYQIISSIPINYLYPGKILGLCSTEDEVSMVSTQILKGDLPEGISIFDDGTIGVKNVNQIKPGKFKIKAEFIDVHGNSFTEKIKFEILEAISSVDIETSIHIMKPKFINPKLTNHYKTGDVIAQFHDPDGMIIEAKLIRGVIPPGVKLVQNKKFIVTDPEVLKEGEYFCLFFLKDEKEGNTFIATSLAIGIDMDNINDLSESSNKSVEK
ncbi:hypothetical protein OKW21_004531 [Catalinimonas alkaloidigena]|uniref:hypothetical protein n=1 Tax=Catalinimonas alkaloidigena TaxID=1075417 RepID=UPI002405182D|nr:hypothetical protein [Catalinimonas alkaloidigena]MDF9799268.1 hypothetical protein [Catalinimonas alkaloidigena]